MKDKKVEKVVIKAKIDFERPESEGKLDAVKKRYPELFSKEEKK